VNELDIIACLSGLSDPQFFKNDACCLAGNIFTKDILIENVHFLPDCNPKNLAKKALRVNLSDIASCGATPKFYLLGIALNNAAKQKCWIEEFILGLSQDQEKYQIRLLGGDTIIHDGPITISVTMIGSVNDGITLKRNGAKIDDLVCVSGTIGDSYLGLLSYKGDIAPDKYFKSRYNLPEPKVELGKKILNIATSCIDISDGLLHDANHIAQNSGVMIEINSDLVPVSDNANALLIQDPGLKDKMIVAGDDYELLFTVPQKFQDQIKDYNCTVIGKVKQGSGVSLIKKGKKLTGFKKLGFVHK
jgi:thiamine-monophosphate kinase